MGLLVAADSQPVAAERLGSGALFLFTCDHAGREIPHSLGDLGLPASAFDQHIAWDIGAGAVTRRVAAALGACAILQRYSRLVIDCNRNPARPDAIPESSDGVVIPGNASLLPAQRQARIDAIQAPYHAAIASELDERKTLGLPTLVIFIHSFTPRMNGLDRPWRFGVIRESGSRFSQAVLDRLRAEGAGPVGDNEPYAMDGVDYSAPTHALGRGLDYLELEIRQDLITEDAGQAEIADLLVRVLASAARDIGHADLQASPSVSSIPCRAS